MKVRISCASGLRKQRPDAFVGFPCARSTSICAQRFGLDAETHLRELARENVTQVAIPDPCGCSYRIAVFRFTVVWHPCKTYATHAGIEL